MTKKNKQEEVLRLCQLILNKFDDEDVDLDVALAVSGQLFATMCRNASLDADQFLYLCHGISEKNKWKDKKEEPHVREKASTPN